MSKVQLIPVALNASSPARLVWIEMSSQDMPRFSPASEKMLADWKENGWKVDAQIVSESAFWQTIHDSDAPFLLNATSNALLQFDA